MQTGDNLTRQARILSNQMGGVPCIRGLRIPVATVVDMVANGMTEREILQAYPDLEAEDRRRVDCPYGAVVDETLPLVQGDVFPQHLGRSLVMIFVRQNCGSCYILN